MSDLYEPPTPPPSRRMLLLIIVTLAVIAIAGRLVDNWLMTGL